MGDELLMRAALELARQAEVCMGCAGLFAGADQDIQYQTQVADPVGMQCMAGAPRLMWVVADFRTLLMAIEHFDGGIDVEYPGRVQRGG